MKLGLSTYTYTWEVGVPGSPPQTPLTARALIQRASSLGTSVVQLADNLPLQNATDSDVKRLGCQATALGIQLEVGTRGIDPIHLRRYLVIAGMLGAKLLRVVVDSPEHHPEPAEVIDSLSRLRDDFKRAGVVLAIENHDRFTSTELRDVIVTLGIDWTGICLDTVNSFGALEGPDVVIQTLAPFAVNIHVKDFTITRAPHMMGFSIEGCPAGEGRLNIPALLKRIREHRDDVTAVLELWTPPESTLDATIAKEQDWAIKSVAFLRLALERVAS